MQRFEGKVQAMSEKLKTIKELADELGVSKQGVRYHMKSIPQEELKKNKKWWESWK